MPAHEEIRVVPFKAHQMYDLVADIMKYPDFIPWCIGMRLKSTSVVNGEGELIADMIVRYKMFTEKFRSRVVLLPDENKISAHYMNGPFEKMENRWLFTDLENGASEVNFSIDFEFRNRVLQRLAMEVFDRAFRKMSDAFIARAEQLYSAKDIA